MGTLNPLKKKIINMKYENIKPAIFLKRINRFIAEILIDNKLELCHVKNTGRCQELLLPNSKIFVQYNNSSKRKTKYSLISVYKNQNLINMDSQIPNYVVAEALSNNVITEISDISNIKTEVKFNNSRFDIYFEQNDKKCFMEVKGVTLENNGISMFPDAPSLRAIKHINELIYSIKYGYLPYIFFLVQMDFVNQFTPNFNTHPEFCNCLKFAKQKGLNILAYNSNVYPNEITIKNKVFVNI